jgi:hypothetical protein
MHSEQFSVEELRDRMHRSWISSPIAEVSAAEGSISPPPPVQARFTLSASTEILCPAMHGISDISSVLGNGKKRKETKSIFADEPSAHTYSDACDLHCGLKRNQTPAAEVALNLPISPSVSLSAPGAVILPAGPLSKGSVFKFEAPGAVILPATPLSKGSVFKFEAAPAQHLPHFQSDYARRGDVGLACTSAPSACDHKESTIAAALQRITGNNFGAMLRQPLCNG